MIEASDIASVLVPVPITAAMVTVTAGGAVLPEDPSQAWSFFDTYALGDRVHSPVTRRVYESLKAGNQGKDPTNPVNRTTAAGVGTWWLDIGPTNAAAAFDGLTNSQTAGASPLVYTLAPGAINAFSLLGIEADLLEVTVRSAPGGTVLYSLTDDLEGSEPADYYEYFFDRFKPLTQVIATDIEPYSSSVMEVRLTKATGQPKLGMLAAGDLKPLGVPERDTTVEPKTYSYIDEDDYGTTKIVRRPKARPLSMKIKVAYEEADNVLQTVEDVIDIPVVFIGSRAKFHSKLTTLGLLSARMDYSTFPERTLYAQVKGMT